MDRTSEVAEENTEVEAATAFVERGPRTHVVEQNANFTQAQLQSTSNIERIPKLLYEEINRPELTGKVFPASPSKNSRKQG